MQTQLARLERSHGTRASGHLERPGLWEGLQCRLPQGGHAHRAPGWAPTCSLFTRWLYKQTGACGWGRTSLTTSPSLAFLSGAKRSGNARG